MSQPLTPPRLAQLVAADIPTAASRQRRHRHATAIADQLMPEHDVTLHAENGMLGMAPRRGATRSIPT